MTRTATLEWKVDFPGRVCELGPDRLDGIIESLAIGYARRESPDWARLEASVDALLRYTDRLQWWACGVRLGLYDDEIDRYAVMLESETR